MNHMTNKKNTIMPKIQEMHFIIKNFKTMNTVLLLLDEIKSDFKKLNVNIDFMEQTLCIDKNRYFEIKKTILQKIVLCDELVHDTNLYYENYEGTTSTYSMSCLVKQIRKNIDEFDHVIQNYLE